MEANAGWQFRCAIDNHWPGVESAWDKPEQAAEWRKKLAEAESATP